jgi:hypothetical protein
MNVNFLAWGPMAASSRYRSIIPEQQLRNLGVTPGNDWLVIGKHGWTAMHTDPFKRICYDVCDDHFNDEHREYYRAMCDKADLVTCNSLEMARVIKKKTGRDATVIPDPYEQPEKAPRVHDSLLWFGHQSNLKDLEPWLGLPKLRIVSNGKEPWVTPWSPEVMDRAFDNAGLVIIPTGKSMAKSGNRAIESIRRGLFVVAGYLPAYADLGMYCGDIGDGVDWALSHRGEVLDRIKRAQAYVAHEYSPERIGRMWLEALDV